MVVLMRMKFDVLREIDEGNFYFVGTYANLYPMPPDLALAATAAPPSAPAAVPPAAPADAAAPTSPSPSPLPRPDEALVDVNHFPSFAPVVPLPNSIRRLQSGVSLEKLTTDYGILIELLHIRVIYDRGMPRRLLIVPVDRLQAYYGDAVFKDSRETWLF